jgi:hypothetical protein
MARSTLEKALEKGTDMVSLGSGTFNFLELGCDAA